jgi:hypothetical protein
VIIEVLWRPIPTFCRGALSLSLSPIAGQFHSGVADLQPTETFYGEFLGIGYRRTEARFQVFFCA